MIRYGTAGWSFEDWHGTFYPSRQPDLSAGPGALFSGVPDRPGPSAAELELVRRQPLRYYARYFDLVELNASFYRTPAPEQVQAWVEQTADVPGRFLFSVKAPQALSHAGDTDPAVVGPFRRCLRPLEDAERLAAVLVQFPHSFSRTDKTQGRLRRIAEALEGLPLVAEVRHRSWGEPRALELFDELRLTQVAVDQRQSRTTLSPQHPLGGQRRELAYVRLHGRSAAWFDPKAGRDAKYDYLYSASELGEWAGRIEALSREARQVLVIANNHYRGQAPANALELRRRLEGRALAVPEPLLETYPRLAEVTR